MRDEKDTLLKFSQLQISAFYVKNDLYFGSVRRQLLNFYDRQEHSSDI
jgi:hypothetical protein